MVNVHHIAVAERMDQRSAAPCYGLSTITSRLQWPVHSMIQLCFQEMEQLTYIQVACLIYRFSRFTTHDDRHPR